MIRFFYDACGRETKNYVNVTLTGSKNDDPLNIERITKTLCPTCYEETKSAVCYPIKTEDAQKTEVILDLRQTLEKQREYNEMILRRLQHLLQSKFILSFDLVTRRGDYARNIEEADEVAKKGDEIL